MHFGRAATRGLLPWHVSVGVRRNRGPLFTPFEGHQGGGTIVGARWVLTAAHCLAAVSDLLTPDGRLETTADVRVTVSSGTDLRAPVREVDVTFVQVHPDFHAESLEHDVALLRLAADMDGAARFDPDDLQPGDCGILAGWGETHSATQVVPELAWARLHVASDHECALPRCSGLSLNPRVMFAVGGERAACPEFPRASARQGDSGGGFVVTTCGVPRIHGVVSWSAAQNDARPGPHVLTRSSAIAAWFTRETL
jgi:secreted trypsin-like serine protease